MQTTLERITPDFGVKAALFVLGAVIVGASLFFAMMFLLGAITAITGPIDTVVMGHYLHMEAYPVPGPTRIFFDEHALIDISCGYGHSAC